MSFCLFRQVIRRSHLWQLYFDALCTHRQNKVGSAPQIHDNKDNIWCTSLARVSWVPFQHWSLYLKQPPVTICMRQTFVHHVQIQERSWQLLGPPAWTEIWETGWTFDADLFGKQCIKGFHYSGLTERVFTEFLQRHSNPYAPSLTRHKVNCMASL